MIALGLALLAALAGEGDGAHVLRAVPIEASVATVRPAPRGILERRARELEAELGVPVTVEAQGVGAPLTSLRIGRPGAPEIAVLDAGLISPAGPEDGERRVERARATARSVRASPRTGARPPTTPRSSRSVPRSVTARRWRCAAT